MSLDRWMERTVARLTSVSENREWCTQVERDYADCALFRSDYSPRMFMRGLCELVLCAVDSDNLQAVNVIGYCLAEYPADGGD